MNYVALTQMNIWCDENHPKIISNSSANFLTFIVIYILVGRLKPGTLLPTVNIQMSERAVLSSEEDVLYVSLIFIS